MRHTLLHTFKTKIKNNKLSKSLHIANNYFVKQQIFH